MAGLGTDHGGSAVNVPGDSGHRLKCRRTYKKLLKMAIEIVDFPMKNDDFPLQNVSSPEGICFQLCTPLNFKKHPQESRGLVLDDPLKINGHVHHGALGHCVGTIGWW